MLIQEHDYTIEGSNYKLAFDIDEGVLTPIYYNKDGVEIGRFDTLYADIQEDINPEQMAQLIVDNFNRVVSENSGTELTWNEKLLAFFRTRVVLVDNRLKIKE